MKKNNNDNIWKEMRILDDNNDRKGVTINNGNEEIMKMK